MGNQQGSSQNNYGTQVQALFDSSSVRSESIQSSQGGVPLHDQQDEGNASTGQSSTISNKSARSESGLGGLVTARFKHVVTEGGHAVITGRGGETLQRCEDEPIHIPGAVQSFGLLIALREEDGKFVVRVVSENSMQIVGYTPQQLFQLDNFLDILTEEQADNFLDHFDFIRDEDMDLVSNGPEVFMLSIRSPVTRKLQKLWCAAHINEANNDLVICEFELEDDNINPLVPPNESTPEPPENTLGSDPTPEEYQQSTINVSKPLRVLRSARKKKGEAAAMEVFNIMSQVQEQLSNANSLQQFLKILVGVVKELTGFHRVMIYQFDSAWNGSVVTELLDPRATKDLYHGLHFPASDIPKQARDLYKVNKVRLLYDREQETSRLVCRTMEDLENPLDLTYSYLRAMSPIHIKYLRNMAVRASMSISINAFDELWGLISCHAYGGKGMRVSFPIRKMCRLVGDTASRNIERLSYASRLQARKLINTVPTEANPSGYIIASSDDLLKLFDADCGLLSIRDETKILGRVSHSQELLAMLEYLRMRKYHSVMTSQDFKVDFPDLRYPPGFQFIAGLLLVPLTSTGEDFIVFFRKGQLREVRWAGNPYEKFIKEGTEGYLEPRKSFKSWNETIVGKCREWTEEQIETAAVLCLVYGKFIEVWRQKEVALQNSQLTRLLLANSAHEVRTPLNAIINYLEIALEGSLDGETRDNLAKSHSASKSLIYVINDLLDLTKTEEGGELIKDEIFDLPSTLKEATDMFLGDAKRKNIAYEIIEYPGVPRLVVGDQRRVRQAISNIVSNAFQNTEHGQIKVESYIVREADSRADVEIAVEDTGSGMPQSKLDALFRELEQVQSENEAADMLDPPPNEDQKLLTPGKASNRALGLGLAVVARVVRNMNGQLRLKSEEGKGSRFVIQLGFDLPDGTDQPEDHARSITFAQGNHPTTPPVKEGELTLVKSAQRPQLSRRSMSRKNSTESAKSLHSLQSQGSRTSGRSGRSDVDRMIEAIQEPVMGGQGETSLERSMSAGSLGARAQKESLPGSPTRARSSHEGQPAPSLALPERSDSGSLAVADSKTPIKPVRLGEDTMFQTFEKAQITMHGKRRLFDEPEAKKEEESHPNSENLRVLVAEDDPINSKIIQKRLEKLQHNVRLTINGEECAHAYEEHPKEVDVILMDMQV